MALVIGRVCTVYYFAHFLILMPLVGWFEKPLKLPASISEAVLKTEPGAAGSKA